jgi:hypothetical protein
MFREADLNDAETRHGFAQAFGILGIRARSIEDGVGLDSYCGVLDFQEFLDTNFASFASQA